MDIQAILKQYPAADALFRFCEDADIEQCRIQKLRAGNMLAHKYEPIEACHFIVSGECSAYNEFENGRHYMVSHFGHGMMIGEMELVAGLTHYLHSVHIEKKGWAIAIPAAIHAKWMNIHHTFARSAAERLAVMLCAQSWTSGEAKIFRADERVARFLMRACHAADESQTDLILSDTREQLSDKLGMSVRTLNRTLAAFSQRGWIQIKKGKITLDAAHYARLAAAWSEKASR